MQLANIPIIKVDGIGNKLMRDFHEIGVKSVKDLLDFFPSRYATFDVVSPTKNEHNQKITVKGVILTEPVLKAFKPNRSSLSFRLDLGKDELLCVVFNREFLRPKLTIGTEVVVQGNYNHFTKNMTVSIVSFDLSAFRLEPLYPTTLINQTTIRKVISRAFSKFGDLIEETLPQDLREKYKLLDAKTLHQFAHFPKDGQEVEQVKRRVKYEELLVYLLKISLIKSGLKKEFKPPKVIDLAAMKAFIQTLPFELTQDQKQAVNDIYLDLKKPYPANRLIQGDVGSGKTVVAALAVFASYTAGYQSALMAPTEVLAKQHYATFSKMVAKTALKVALLTSQVKSAERKQRLNDLKTQKIDFIIGTHALIQDEVTYANLGLVITDEQHRFGVMQRQALRKKGASPDVLYLTATPIPRTMALTVYGDLDVSSIKTLPKGRQAIFTEIVEPKQVSKIYQSIDKAIKEHHQVYWITPLIDISETKALSTVYEAFERVNKALPNARVVLLHGQMSSTEKEEAMQAFQTHQADVLVSTTIVEVGVNVVNATIMVIEDAHQFGISQLHQLRGRVGRGSLLSTCYLLTPNVDEERLRLLEKTTDGFALSEADLRLRGPGDYFSTAQTGAPKFKMADLVEDFHIVTIALKDAQTIVDRNIWDKDAEYYRLKKAVLSSLTRNETLLD